MGNAEPKKVALQHVGECLWRHTQSGKYYAIVRTAGKQIKKSLRTTDNALAKRRLADFRKKTQRVQSGDKSLRFQELASLWLASVKPNQATATFDASSDRVTQLNHFFGTSEARSITRRDIDDWKARRCSMKSRLGRPISSRTYNYELQTLNQIFRYGTHTIQCLIDNPAEGQKRRRLDTKERLAPTREEFNKLVAELRAQPKASYPGGAYKRRSKNETVSGAVEK